MILGPLVGALFKRLGAGLRALRERDWLQPTVCRAKEGLSSIIRDRWGNLHFPTWARGASRIRFARDMAAEGRAFGSAPLMARSAASRSLLGAAYHAACGRVRPERLRVACVVHVPRPDHSRILPVPPADELPAAATGAGAALGAPVRPSRPQRLGADDQQPGSIEQLRPRSERCAYSAGLCASPSLSLPL